MQIDIDFEDWPTSPTIRRLGANYHRKSCTTFRDAPARLTPRQANFYRNLIRIAEQIGDTIPVDFTCRDVRVHLDYGCIKIAELAGFIAKLDDGPDGVVETIQLAWRTDGTVVPA